MPRLQREVFVTSAAGVVFLVAFDTCAFKHATPLKLKITHREGRQEKLFVTLPLFPNFIVNTHRSCSFLLFPKHRMFFIPFLQEGFFMSMCVSNEGVYRVRLTLMRSILNKLEWDFL